MSRTRNLVIGFDGTWNEPEQISGKEASTNVVKFLSALAGLRGGQVKHYEEGVGTRAWELLPGGIYGYGLSKRILGGYRFLRRRFTDSNWQRNENKVFLLGFSRGAYTARRLAGVIAHSGLPVKSRDSSLGWEMYKEQDFESARRLKQEGRFFDIPIEMVGVWDTVKATNDADYHDKLLSWNVVAGYHAMAIDERRGMFGVKKWRKDPRATQVWFAGVHSNVGGGYASHSLSDVALRWMIRRAMEHGLQFRAGYYRDNVKPESRGKIHESYKGIWKPLGQRRRRIADGDLVHRSVRTRLRDVAKYDPPNLPASPNFED